ncbi:hypothetical protein [Yersinia phage fHe-Yen9-04]|uniref:Uncharacterized protein n=2 Tax=Eneladusvirus Yen904 TaxID=2560849 RepID=A0A2C9CXG2_9CAUD|nr:hypothetical protein FDJ41_gp476 [Yersinia phage fHe-Yen9-04]SOK58704.1 hypothetical protein [Yersinia phage fHe-Yen9-04]SOK59238.1 hypothetical protein [Yersinia phage fHe-Yen9-03]VUE36473.1 hypothetical protein [Yersinia phage fHe-Yen9-04]
MSIKVDPETQKAVDPESIGKDSWKRFLLAVLIVSAAIITYKIL